MKNLPSIVFMVNTEYHLLLSVGIMREYYKEGYNLIVYRVSPVNGTRLNNLDFSKSNIIYREILYDYSHPNKNLKDELNEIVKLRPNQFFFFLENKFWMNYFFKKLHTNGAKIILGPDGMKAYANLITPFSIRVKEYVKGFYYMIKARMFNSFPHVEKKYATSEYIDEVWVENVEAYINNTNKKVIEFHISYDEEFLSELNVIFNTKKEDFSILNQKTILFLDSSFSSASYYDTTIKILKQIQEKYPDRKLVVKSHQNSKDRSIYKDAIKNIGYLESNYPAELYIANAKDCIVIALISTSLLFYNPTCKYYWIYPMYKEMVDCSNVINPTIHIKVVDTISDIKDE